MNERRRLLGNSNAPKTLYTKRFYPAGTYYWTVPEGCTEVDVFLVGGGGGGDTTGGGSGYTKTFKSSTSGWRDGNAVSVTPGQSVKIIVGAGGAGGDDGSYSQFLSSAYRANGGTHGYTSGSGLHYGGNGGSGGGTYGNGGADGSDGDHRFATSSDCTNGKGQGHTTRDFGESSGKRNAGGGSGQNTASSPIPSGGRSDYTDGSGQDGTNTTAGGRSGIGGGGYGGGGGAGRNSKWETCYLNAGRGGDGTVLIRYYAYEQ